MADSQRTAYMQMTVFHAKRLLEETFELSSPLVLSSQCGAQILAACHFRVVGSILASVRRTVSAQSDGADGLAGCVLGDEAVEARVARLHVVEREHCASCAAHLLRLLLQHVHAAYMSTRTMSRHHE